MFFENQIHCCSKYVYKMRIKNAPKLIDIRTKNTYNIVKRRAQYDSKRNIKDFKIRWVV